MMLENINALLSGTRRASDISPASTPNRQNLSAAIGGLNLNFTASVGDIWGGGGGNAFDAFGGGNNRATVNIEDLEGRALFDAVNAQCLEMATACSGQAMVNMVTSAYTVLISQDCNAYERNLDGQKTALESLVREGQRLMMEARLRDFQDRNSQTMNDCISGIRQAMLEPFVCGPGWRRCLDFTGQFVNPTNGEPIFSERLFDLANQMNLTVPDAFAANGPNAPFIRELNTRRSMVSQAFSRCTESADMAWDFFMQQALIEISQAQGALLEEVKGTCIETIRECYDTQTGAMRNLSGGTSAGAQVAGAVQSMTAALGHRVAADMCENDVFACAALFSPPGACVIDRNTGMIGNATGQCTDFRGRSVPCVCGLQSLLTFIETVDDVTISALCRQDLESFAQELCTPTATGGAAAAGTGNTQGSVGQTGGGGGMPTDCSPWWLIQQGVTGMEPWRVGEAGRTTERTECNDSEWMTFNNLRATQSQTADAAQLRASFPFACRTMPLTGANSFQEALLRRAMTSCINPNTGQFDPSGVQAVRDVFNSVRSGMSRVMHAMCNDSPNGIWMEDFEPREDVQIEATWMANVFGGQEAFLRTMPGTSGFTFGGSLQQPTRGTARDLDPRAVSMPTNTNVNFSTINENDRIAMFGDNAASAAGFGICLNPSAAAQCEALNANVGQRIANFNRDTQTCNFEPNYSQVMCTTILGGQWSAQDDRCVFTPR